MDAFENAGWLLGAGVAAALFIVLTYVLLFKAKESRYPNAARGTGLCLLAGMLKLLSLLLAEKVSPAFGAPLVNYVLVGLLAVGYVLMTAGLGKGA